MGYLDRVIGTFSALELQVYLTAAVVVVPLFELDPVVCDLSGEGSEEDGVGAKQVEGSSEVALVLKQKKIFFPECFVIAVGNEGSFVERSDQLRVAAGFQPSDVTSPHFDIADVGSVLVVVVQLHYDECTLL
jgi:hypothetical protein